MFQWFFSYSLYCCCHFCVFLSQLSKLVWKLAEEISPQSFGPPANGNKSNAQIETQREQYIFDL